MATLGARPPTEDHGYGQKALSLSASIWFTVALVGQWAFAYYIFVSYGGAAVQGDWGAWSRRLFHGILENDPVGNAAIILHIALAFYVTAFGPLQLIPAIRNRAPHLHRWNGRLYGATAILISLGALYMVWTRGATGTGVFTLNSIAITINGVLIIVFAALTIRYALARNIAVHHRWAMRLFIAMSAVWLMRVGYGFWLFIFAPGAAPGMTRQVDGWFDIALAFAATLAPLVFLETYYLARKARAGGVKWLMAVSLLILSVFIAIGVAKFSTVVWLRYI